MDDHVHLVARLAPKRGLTHTIMSWKSYSTHCLHRSHERERAVWQNEFYDRIIRDERELHETIEYVRQNPSRRWPAIQDYPWLKVFEG
jgi:REP element-mobilizing transposase RayT